MCPTLSGITNWLFSVCPDCVAVAVLNVLQNCFKDAIASFIGCYKVGLQAGSNQWPEQSDIAPTQSH